MCECAYHMRPSICIVCLDSSYWKVIFYSNSKQYLKHLIQSHYCLILTHVFEPGGNWELKKDCKAVINCERSSFIGVSSLYTLLFQSHYKLMSLLLVLATLEKNAWNNARIMLYFFFQWFFFISFHVWHTTSINGLGQTQFAQALFRHFSVCHITQSGNDLGCRRKTVKRVGEWGWKQGVGDAFTVCLPSPSALRKKTATV